MVDDEPEIIEAYQKVLSVPLESNESLQLDEMARELFIEKSETSLTEGPEVGFLVSTARQGKDAVTAVTEAVKRKAPFSVAFVDMRMPPGIDGLETARQILEIDSEIELVFVTAYTDRTRQEIIEALGNRRFFYLKKPFDPDEVRQMAESLSFRWKTAREYEELQRMKSEFIATVSHELRTPLSSIAGFIDLIIEGDAGPVTKEQQEFLEIVAANAARMESIVSDLLDVEKIMQQKMTLHTETLNLTDHLLEICNSFKTMAQKKGLTLETDLEKNIVIQGDREGLTRIFANLLSNAVKYTQSGWVRMKLILQEEGVTVTVSDSGIGISEQDLPRLFTRFFRVDSKYTRETGGTGLGLVIVKSLVELHQGHIEVKSELHKGTEFVVTFPLENKT